jgi:hypothetical protein
MQSDYQFKTIDEKRTFWQKQFCSWRDSGLSQSQYCRQKGIRSSQWFYWKKRLGESNAALTLVPLSLSSMRDQVVKEPAVRVITPNGFTIEMVREVLPASLGQLIREVAAL